jgi:hypothetical protein
MRVDAVAALAIATGSFSVKIASVVATISISDTFFITLALLFGPAQRRSPSPSTA